MIRRVVSVNVGRPVTHHWGGATLRTAIVKSAVFGPVEATAAGLAGDEQADQSHHGGPYHAVYAYAAEDYAWWAAELGRELPPGLFGENLTTAGVDLTDAVLGQRWRVGHAVLEVCAPRLPCQTFARRMGEPHWVKRFTARGATGCYLRVVQPGDLQAGDAIDIEHADSPWVTVSAAFRALTTEPELLPRLADVAALPPQTRARADAARATADAARAAADAPRDGAARVGPD